MVDFIEIGGIFIAGVEGYRILLVDERRAAGPQLRQRGKLCSSLKFQADLVQHGAAVQGSQAQVTARLFQKEMGPGKHIGALLVQIAAVLPGVPVPAGFNLNVSPGSGGPVLPVGSEAGKVVKRVAVSFRPEHHGLPLGRGPGGKGHFSVPQMPEGNDTAEACNGGGQQQVNGRQPGVFQALPGPGPAFPKRPGPFPRRKAGDPQGVQGIQDSGGLQPGDTPGVQGVGIVIPPQILEQVHHVGNIEIPRRGKSSKGPQQALVRNTEKAQQQKKKGRVPLVHFYAEEKHHRHQKHGTGKQRFLSFGKEEQPAAQQGGGNRRGIGQKLEKRSLRQGFPVPTHKSPEIIGVDAVKIVVVQSVLVFFRQPMEIKVCGKGQGQHQDRA